MNVAVPKFAGELMEVLERADVREYLYWNVTDGEVKFWVIVNDVFAYATADGEFVNTREDYELVVRCIALLDKFGCEEMFPELYTTYKRQRLPLEAHMVRWRATKPDVAKLFEEAISG